MTRIDYSVLSDINILKVEDRAKQLRLNHVYNIFHELAPQYLNRKEYQNAIRTVLEEVHTILKCDSQTFYYNAILDWKSTR